MDESDQVHIDQVKFQIQTRSSHQPTFQTGRAVRLALTPVRVLSTFVIGPATLSSAGFRTSGLPMCLLSVKCRILQQNGRCLTRYCFRRWYKSGGMWSMWTSCSFIAPYFRSRHQNGISFIAFADRSSIRFIFDYTFDLINMPSIYLK